MSVSIPVGQRIVPITLAAEIMGKSIQGARRWVKKNNCGEKQGRFWFLDTEKFLANFGHLLHDIEDSEDYTTSPPVPVRP
jgi:hypothetical protein